MPPGLARKKKKTRRPRRGNIAHEKGKKGTGTKKIMGSAVFAKNGYTTEELCMIKLLSTERYHSSARILHAIVRVATVSNNISIAFTLIVRTIRVLPSRDRQANTPTHLGRRAALFFLVLSKLTQSSGGVIDARYTAAPPGPFFYCACTCD